MVILPGVRAQVARKIVLVSGAMELVRSALGDHLHLRSRCCIEVRGLVADAHLVFFNRFHR